MIFQEKAIRCSTVARRESPIKLDFCGMDGLAVKVTSFSHQLLLLPHVPVQTPKLLILFTRPLMISTLYIPSSTFKYQRIMRQQADLRKKIEDYSYGLNEILSDNTSSKIYKGIRENTKESVAIKVINIKGFKTKSDKKPLEAEIQVLRKSDHPNILKCLDVYSTLNNCYIITEYCSSGNLKTLINNKKTKFTEAEALGIFKDICQGYKYLFMKGYVHRNIDPSNILIRNGEYKLADFGMASKQLDLPIKASQPISTSPYRSPESLLSQMVGPKCDIWALGVILYQLLHNKLPFPNYDYRFSFTTAVQFGSIPEKAKELIQKCLLPDSLRITFPQFESHPYITQLMSSAPPAGRFNIKQDYRSVPMTKVTSNIQNKPASQIDRLINLKKNRGENVIKSQIAFMKFLLRFRQLLPECKLHFLVAKQILSIHDSLNRCIALGNPFEADYIQDFFMTQKSNEYVQEIHDYSKKCFKLHQQLQKYIIRGSKDRRFLQYLDKNLARSEGFVLSTIPWAMEFTKSSLEELENNRQFQKLQDQDTLPKQLQTMALRVDYSLTYYQLNNLCASNFHDLIEFYEASKIDQIVRYQPASMQKKHVKDIQRKYVQLGL